MTVPTAAARPARSTDRAEVVRMRRSLWPDSTSEEVDALLERPAKEGVLLVVEADGTGLSGFAEVGLRPFADGCRSSPVAYLEGIWVDAGARRRGVASALVGAAVGWARSLRLAELASDCTLDNLPSRAFHAAAGFREVQRNVTFRREIGPASTERSGDVPDG